MSYTTSPSSLVQCKRCRKHGNPIKQGGPWRKNPTHTQGYAACDHHDHDNGAMPQGKQATYQNGSTTRCEAHYEELPYVCEFCGWKVPDNTPKCKKCKQSGALDFQGVCVACNLEKGDKPVQDIIAPINPLSAPEPIVCNSCGENCAPEDLQNDHHTACGRSAR